MINTLSAQLRSISPTFSINRSYNRSTIAAFAKAIGPIATALDVGGGRSPYRRYFDANRYLAFDLFNPSTDTVADACAIPLDGGAVDLVVLTEVLEHIPTPALALDEIWRVLKPGGHFLLTVPFLWGVHEHVDVTRWTEEGLAQFLQDHNFSVVQVKKRGGIFSVIGAFINQIPLQLFGPLGTHKSLLHTILYLGLWLMSLPMAWLLSTLDRFDHAKKFTLGYCVLAQK